MKSSGTRYHCACAVLAAILLFIATGRVEAEIRKFTYTGYVSRVTDPGDMLGGTVQLFDPVSGYFAYDTATADTIANVQTGSYPYSAPLGQVGVTMTTSGGFTAGSNSSVGMTVWVMDNTGGFPAGSDVFQINSGAAQTSNPTIGIPLAFQLSLVDPAGTAISNDALPSTFDLSDWDTEHWQFFSVFDHQGGNQLSIGTTITDLTAVPEPSSLVLLAIGTAFTVGLVRRKRLRAVLGSV